MTHQSASQIPSRATDRFSPSLPNGRQAAGSGVREQAVLADFITHLSPLGVRRADLIGVWITLKSKPVIIFCASDGELAEVVSSAVATAIAGDRVVRFQGHPWWATGRGINTHLASAQERLTTIRLQAFLDEAASEHGALGLSAALFERISRAELSSMLKPLSASGASEISIRLQLDLIREEQPLPRSVYLLASMESVDMGESFDLSPRAGMINLYKDLSIMGVGQDRLTQQGLPHLEAALLTTREFHPGEAWRNVPRLDGASDPLRFIGQTYAILMREGLSPARGMLQDAMLYLGNAWDVTGKGLFDEDAESNTKHAVDQWLLNAVLPRYLRALRNQPKFTRAFSGMILNYPLPPSPSLVAALDASF